MNAALLLCLLVGHPHPTEAEPEDRSEPESEPENPWLEGPAAPPPPSEQMAEPPREPEADVEPLEVPPVPPQPPLPIVDDGLRPAQPGLRMTTTLEREEVFQWGDLNLADALVMVPGVWWPQQQAASPQPSARGLPSEHLAVRVDKIPVLPAQAFPGFPALAHVPLDEVRRVEYRHGPRVGLGLEGASAGALEIDTLPDARDLGEEGAVTGRVRGGYGGPDIEKALFLRGETGFRRARVSLAAGGFHRDNLRLGRGAGLLENSFGLGGYLYGRADVVPHEGLRMWVKGQLSRQARTPLPYRCEEDADGRYTDCVFAQDRARDTLAVGVDTSHRLFGLRFSSSSRFHVQRFSEDWQREGNTRFELETTRTELWRGGALVEGTVTGPLFDLTLLGLRPEVAVGLEHLRDRVSSVYQARSQRFSDSLPDFVPNPELSPLASGGLRNLTRGYVRAGLYGDRLSVEGRGQLGYQQLSLVRPDLERMEGRLVGRRVLTPQGELSVRLGLLPQVAVFGALIHSERPETLFELSRGPQRLEDDDDAWLPALPGRTAFSENAVEVGTEVDLVWLKLKGVLWGGERRAPTTLAPDPALALGGDATPHPIRLGRRQAGGVEGRARWQTPFDGLAAEGTLAAMAIDEGVFFRSDEPFAITPAAGVPRPTGAAAIHWAPTDWPFLVWGRLRYALPQARLAPGEELDTALCPEGLIDPQLEPCSGLFGYALYDVGMAFHPVPALRIEGMASNLVDVTHQLRISDWPGGGMAARATATLSF